MSEVLSFTCWTFLCVFLGIIVGYSMRKEEMTFLGYFFKEKDIFQKCDMTIPNQVMNSIALYTNYGTLEKKRKSHVNIKV